MSLRADVAIARAGGAAARTGRGTRVRALVHACTFCSRSVLARPTPPLLPPLPPLIATADSALCVPGHASGAAANGKRGRTVATRDRRAERAPGESEAAAGFPDVDQHREAAAPAHHRPPPASALHAHALRTVGAGRCIDGFISGFCVTYSCKKTISYLVWLAS